MNSKLLIVVSALLIGAVVSEVDEYTCPEFKTVEALDERYLGTWYALYRVKNAWGEGQSCSEAVYRMKENGNVEVVNTGYVKELGLNLPITVVGEGVFSSRPGSLIVSFDGLSKSSEPNYNVLETDYDSYSVVYSCRPGQQSTNTKKLEFGWLLSRTRSLPSDVLVRLNKEYAKLGIDANSVEQVDQSNC